MSVDKKFFENQLLKVAKQRYELFPGALHSVVLKSSFIVFSQHLYSAEFDKFEPNFTQIIH